MNFNNLVILFLVALISFSCSNSKDIKLGYWDYEWMTYVKRELKHEDTRFSKAYEQLIKDAEKALTERAFSVTYKEILPPSGSKHDYMSMGPYWWPDPDKPDGLPYINRDGIINPERNKLDRPQVGGLIDNVNTLTLAWFFSGKKEYAVRAVELLKVWFLNEETLMNPNLKYGQSIPGITEGRGIGIIDTHGFHTLVDAITLLGSFDILTEPENEALKDWFEEYFNWLTTSKLGNDEDNAHNNHATAYDVQVCGIAYFLGKEDYVKHKISEVPVRRIDTQIKSDGKQPFELTRTKALSYSVGNSVNFFNLGSKGLLVGVDIFNYENPDGGSIKKALDFLVDYIGKEGEWPYKQITDWGQSERSLGLVIRRAASIYDDESYRTLWENYFLDQLNSSRSLLVFPEYSHK